jgi:sugar phosphate isomerase/epimerase
MPAASSPPALSIQLYSLRDHGPLAARLDTVREAGFRAVETIQGLMEDARGTRAMLDERDLAAPSGHVSLAAVRERPEWVVEGARALGIGLLIVPALHGADRPTDAAGWRAVGAELGRVARRLADQAGLRFAFHNHAWEVQRLPDGSLPLDLLLDAGAKDGLGWQADLAWLVRGGDDPAARLDRHGDRLVSVHVKDIAPAGTAEDEDGWADVGHGVLDWADLWRRSTSGGSPLMVAEHDKPEDAARFARRSFAAMQRLAAGAGR